jgi:hypothetical protein
VPYCGCILIPLQSVGWLVGHWLVHNKSSQALGGFPSKELCFPLSQGIDGFKKQYLDKKSPYLHVRKCSTPTTNCPPQHPQQKGRQHNDAATTTGK